MMEKVRKYEKGLFQTVRILEKRRVKWLNMGKVGVLCVIVRYCTHSTADS